MRCPIFFTIKRWIEIAIYFAIASVTPSLGYKIIPKSIQDELSAPNYFPLIFCGGVFLLVLLNRLAGFRLNHIKSILSYPTFLLAVFLASLLIDYNFQTSQVLNVLFGIPNLGFATTTYLFSLFIVELLNFYDQYISAPSRIRNQSKKLENKPIQDFSAEEIIKWAECENPITSADGDFLKTGHRVNRILEYLRKLNRNTVAILGYYGSGKTSLTKLIAQQSDSKDKKKLVFAWVSCWGFNDSVAAQEAVLGKIITSLSNYVDCFAIRGMPSRFVEALSETSNYLSSLLHFAIPKDPDAQLARLTPILRALNTTLIVVVEDTERSSAQFDLESIEGLLNRFRDFPDISFVITASPDSKIDFVRLREHTEIIPDLESETVTTILEIIRLYCQSLYPNDIDLVERKPFYAMPPWMGADKYGMWEFQMVKLLNTPRKLKATIRRFHNAWKALHGEVDIDELLIASCVRVCAPAAFGFLMRRHSDFAKIEKYPNPTGQRQGPDPVVITLKDEWTKLRDQSFDLSAAGRLLQMFLSPEAQAVFGEPQYGRTKLVQEFRSDRRYQERIFNEVITDGGILDQEVLGEIFLAKKHNNLQKIGKRIEESPDFRRVFSDFRRYMLGSKLTNEEFWTIIKEVFASIREKDGRKASSDSEAYFEAINWVELCFSGDLNKFYEAVFELVQASIPHNLRLAVDIYHTLILRSGTIQTLNEYGNRVILSLKTALSINSTKVLDDALDESLPETLHYLIGFNNSSNNQVNLNWRQWNWFGPILLDAIRTNHQKYAPQIALVLGLTLTGSGSEVPVDFLLNENVLKDIFGSDAEAIMVELSKPFVINPAMKQFQIKVHGVNFSLAAIRAQKWLQTKHSQTSLSAPVVV
jgi:hypothetical protein